MPTTLAAQQDLLRRALAVLDKTNFRGPLRDMLTFALADHDDPDTGCLADPGTECIAVKRARQILAGQL